MTPASATWPVSAAWGRTPVPEGIRRTEAILAQAGGRRDLEAYALKGLAGLRAMTGDFEAARTLIARHRATMEEIGRKLMVGGSAQMAGYVEMLAGDAPAAERELRRGYAILDSAGDRAYLPAVAAMLASALEAQGRHAEAERYVETASSMAADGDIDTQFRLLVIRAQLLLAKGRADDTSAWCATRWRWRPTPTSWICRPRVRWSLPRRCGRRTGPARRPPPWTRRSASTRRRANLVSAARVRAALAQMNLDPEVQRE
jgi:ATP/maltotriose-dependent transcriptional regulator MalT